jgi:hypothetical protein
MDGHSARFRFRNEQFFYVTRSSHKGVFGSQDQRRLELPLSLQDHAKRKILKALRVIGYLRPQAIPQRMRTLHKKKHFRMETNPCPSQNDVRLF